MDDLYLKALKHIESLSKCTVSDLPNVLVTPTTARLDYSATVFMTIHAPQKMFYPKYCTTFYRFITVFRNLASDSAIRFGCLPQCITLQARGIHCIFNQDGLANNVFSAVLTASHVRDIVVDIILEVLPSAKMLELSVAAGIAVETYFEDAGGYLGYSELAYLIALQSKAKGEILLSEEAFERIDLVKLTEGSKVNPQDAKEKIFKDFGFIETAYGAKKRLYRFDKEAFDFLLG